MKSAAVQRILLPALMAVALVLSLAYWWLENLPHEMFGTAMFALLGWHLVINRHWFTRLAKGRYDARRIVVVGLHLLLVINMLVLLVTSIVISKSLFAALPIPDSIYLREVHWFSAYWVMMIVGIHVGLHWARVMALCRSFFGQTASSAARTGVLRVTAIIVFGFGVRSFQVLDVWGKLTFTYSLDVWNFKTSVTPFFGHWACVVVLPASLTHYGLAFWRCQSRRRSTQPAASA
ncbi:DUF4405 domain-containing protein [Rhizobium sp.]|uniref:DUF4405 domain-containing protein n=1 Tax=Rhizobium sp. TaxID=391 RepID=UPI0028A665E0